MNESREELDLQARQFYEWNTAYMLEARPILEQMANLRLMFTSPKLIIDVSDMTIEEEWINSEAAKLYHNYEQLLDIIHDRYITERLEHSAPDQVQRR